MGKATVKRPSQILRCFEDTRLEDGQILIMFSPQGEPNLCLRGCAAESFLSHLYSDNCAERHAGIKW